jgi:Alginate export
MRRLSLSRLLLPLAFAPGAALAQAAPAGELTVTASVRARVESWDWFDDAAAGEYTYGGVLARVGVGQERRAFGWKAEVAAPVLVGLPDDAVAAAPLGQLGLGGAYWAANDSAENAAGVFLKQAYLRVGSATAEGHRLRLGRFELVEGTEAAPRDPTLAAVKRDRVAHRLLGNFGWSHAQRSLDGAHYAYGRGPLNVTVVAARPTQGIFRVNGWPGLDVGLGYGAVTHGFGRSGGAQGEGRLFALHYVDGRDAVATDNRPLAARQADQADVAVTTVGGHLLGVFPTGAGAVDVMLWGALQTGEWESQDHRGGAAAVEAGVQPGGLGALKPWLRAGWYRSTGDDDPADGRHETFFQVLPTPRIYARFPFYNGMNLQDVFASLVLRPDPRVTLRGDVHALRLSDGADLWYSGGGAFEDETFGYAGRPGGGRRGLATLVDLGADFRVRPWATVSAYVAGAYGGDVIRAIYPGGGDGRLLYLEVELRR